MLAAAAWSNQLSYVAGPLMMQGALRVNRYNPYEGYVGSDSVGHDILLAGRSHMNRAMDGECAAAMA